MKGLTLLHLGLLMLLCLIVTGCSVENASSVISEAIPENIARIEVSGFYNGELEPWELTQAEIEKLNTWITQLSLKHRTYAEGEAPAKCMLAEFAIVLISMVVICHSHGYILIRHISSTMANGMKLQILRLHRLTCLGLVNK